MEKATIKTLDNATRLEKTAYELYIHDWMISHHIGQREMDVAVEEYVENRQEAKELNIEPVSFLAWLHDYGFGGTLWVSFAEFLDNEYQDKSYMKCLLSEPDFRLYLTQNLEYSVKVEALNVWKTPDGSTYGHIKASYQDDEYEMFYHLDANAEYSFYYEHNDMPPKEDRIHFEYSVMRWLRKNI